MHKRLLVAVAGASVLLFGAALPAAAQDLDVRFESGNATTCAEAGLEGTAVPAPEDQTQGNYEDEILRGTVAGETLTVELLDDDFEITGVVVKGGNAFAVYTGGPPWTGMTAPENASGGAAGISHWFACVVPADVEPTPTPTPSETTTTPPPDTTPTKTPAPVPTSVTAGSPGTSGGSSSGALLGLAALVGAASAGVGALLVRRRRTNEV